MTNIQRASCIIVHYRMLNDIGRLKWSVAMAIFTSYKLTDMRNINLCLWVIQHIFLLMPILQLFVFQLMPVLRLVVEHPLAFGLQTDLHVQGQSTQVVLCDALERDNKWI